jgi:hypothetical protein
VTYLNISVITSTLANLTANNAILTATDVTYSSVVLIKVATFPLILSEVCGK